jgi:hypothetical protein
MATKSAAGSQGDPHLGPLFAEPLDQQFQDGPISF